MREVFCDECGTNADMLYAELNGHKEAWMMRLRCCCRDVITETYADMRSGSPIKMRHVLGLEWEAEHVQAAMERAERSGTQLMQRAEALRDWLKR